ncbi:hypothetical protein ACIPUP_17645 [Pectobacterium actinidiae]|uniref:Uncharacterized protein n=1 Tax=Pectobacterium actinidiae TaxID=1507808 RepID=A0ABW8GF15_9GAMM
MNTIPENTIVVSYITGDTLKIRVQGEDLINKVTYLGFVHSCSFMTKMVENEGDKIELIRELVKLDALFLFGYGWYPSEVMAFYKEKGLYTGKYKIISWSEPSHYQIEEK